MLHGSHIHTGVRQADPSRCMKKLPEIQAASYQAVASDLHVTNVQKFSETLPKDRKLVLQYVICIMRMVAMLNVSPSHQ